jgi:flagellar biosynthesis/type III secretory pathway protein FliH
MDDSVLFDGSPPSSDTAKILKGDDFRVLSRARANVDTAQQQAADIIANAHIEAEQIREAARAVGMQQSSEYLIESAARVARDLDSLEPRLCAIVSDALRRVLDPIPTEKQIAAAVRGALSEVDLSRGVTLIVAPDMLPRVQDHLRQFPIESGTINAIGDPTCEAASAILRTPYGDIELDIDAQLAALDEGIRAALTDADQ